MRVCLEGHLGQAKGRTQVFGRYVLKWPRQVLWRCGIVGLFVSIYRFSLFFSDF